jgi:murein DD-endopeptidase MepM/ murein hydrolase activator NlpD
MVIRDSGSLNRHSGLDPESPDAISQPQTSSARRYLGNWLGIVLILAIMAFPLFNAGWASADDLDDRRAAAEKQAQQNAADLKELESQLEGTSQKLQDAVIALHEVEKRIPIAQAELNSATAEADAAQRRADDLSRQLDDAIAEVGALEQIRIRNAEMGEKARRELAALARLAARGDELSTLGLITGAQSTEDYVANSRAANAAARAKARLIQAVQEADAEARNTEARIQAVQEQIEALKAEADVALEVRLAAQHAAVNKQNEVAQLHAARSKHADDIEAQRDAELAEIEAAKADQEAILADIANLKAQQAERDRIIAEQRRRAEEEAARKAQEEFDGCLSTSSAEACGHLAPKPPEAVKPDLGYGSYLGWPTENRTVTSSYGWRLHPTLKINRFHAGVDLRAACGVPIYASQSGIVVKRQWYGTGGNMILLDHGRDDGGSAIMSRYLHLSSYNVGLNQWVDKGQVIGFSGMTGGISTGCHLHFEVYVNGETVNPITRLP